MKSIDRDVLAGYNAGVEKDRLMGAMASCGSSSGCASGKRVSWGCRRIF